jgi:hypothetical protein
MALLERLAILITADAAGAVNEMKKVADSAQKDLGKAGEAGNNFSGQMTKVGAGMVAAGAGLLAVGVSAASSTTDLGREVMKLQRYTGLNAEEASKLAFAAKMSGVPVDSLATGLGKLSKAMETGSPVFERLGINAKDSDGKLRSMGDILPDLAEKFKTMPNGPEKTATALQLFGRAGMDLMPFLNKGKDGIKQLSDQAEKMGLVLSQDNIGQIRAHIQAQRDMGAALDGVKTQIGLQMIPILDDFTRAFTNLPGPIKDIAGPLAVFGGGFLVAAGSIGMLVGQLQNLLPAFAAVKLFISGADPLTLALMAVGAAVAVAAIAISAFGDNAKNDKSNVDAFTQAIKESGAAADKLTADQIAAKLQSAGLSEAFRNTGISAELLTAAVRSGDQHFKTYGDAMGTNAWVTNKVQDAIKNASPEVIAFNEAIKQAARDGNLTDDQLTKLTKTAGQLAFDFGTTKDKTAELDTTSESLRGTATDLAQAEQAAADATSNHTAAAKTLNDALHGALDPFFGMITAASANEKAQRDATDASIKLYLATNDLNTARAGGNEKDIAEKTKTLADAMDGYTNAQKTAADSAITYETTLNTLSAELRDQKITLEEATTKVNGMEARHLISAETAKYLRDKLKEVADTANTIPDSAGITVSANTQAAIDKLKAFVGLTSSQNIGFGDLMIYSQQFPDGKAMGGRVFPGAAMGTRSGGPHLVGELGPEIFFPDSAGTIVTAEKTRQMLSSSDGGSMVAPVTININTVAGDPIAIERAVLDAIGRAHVRGMTALKP